MPAAHNMGNTNDFASNFLQKKRDKKKQQEEDDKKTTEELHRECDQIEDESLASTRRALNQVMMTEEVGIKTAEKLRKQGDQLDHVYDIISKADESAVASRKDAKKVKKYNNIFGIHFRNPLNRSHKNAEEEYHDAKGKKEEGLSKSHRKPLEDMLSEHHSKRDQHPASPAKYRSEKDREINENLDQIDNIVSNLKVITMDMNDEMDAHDIKMEAIDVVSNHVDVTIREAQAKIKKFTY